MQIIVNEHIHLSRVRPADKPAYLRHLNQTDIIHRQTLLIPYPYTEADADQWIAHATAEPPDSLPLAIRDETGFLIGGCGLHDIIAGHRAEIGYWLAKSYWGRGIATAVVQRLCEHAFRELGLVRVQAHVFSFNRASVRVLEKCGFEREGLLRKHYRKDGDFHDAIVYALVKSAKLTDAE